MMTRIVSAAISIAVIALLFTGGLLLLGLLLALGLAFSAYAYVRVQWLKRQGAFPPPQERKEAHAEAAHARPVIIDAEFSEEEPGR